MIGGFNVLGSLFFGWAGGRWNKLVLLGGIYLVRSLALAVVLRGAAHAGAARWSSPRSWASCGSAWRRW